MKCLNSLIITTSHYNRIESTGRSGAWLEDLAAPYFALKDGGDYITVASPTGGQIPIDSKSLATEAITENTIRFHQDAQAMYHFSHSLPLNEIKADEFDLLFLVGGYGAMWDFPSNKWLQQIIHQFDTEQKAIGLVGHAAAALIELTTANMEPFVKGRKITAFSNQEEAADAQHEQHLFSLESKLISLGALYSKGPDFKTYVITDGNIISGQNPASAVETARQLLVLTHELKATGEYSIV